MIVKRVVKKILSLIPPDNRVLPNKSSGKIIEFIGPSGVGKSTLCSLTKDKLSCKWNNIERLNYCKLGAIAEDIIDLHWTIFKGKFPFIQNLNTASSAKLGLVNYFNKVVLDNIRILRVRENAGFILEEGICHNFFEELNELSIQDLSLLMTNRSLICVLPKDENTVVKQIRKRTKQTGKTVFHHNGLDDKTLFEMTKDYVKGINIFLKRIESLNIPVCKVYIEDGLEVNCKRIIEFERAYNI